MDSSIIFISDSESEPDATHLKSFDFATTQGRPALRGDVEAVTKERVPSSKATAATNSERTKEAQEVEDLSITPERVLDLSERLGRYLSLNVNVRDPESDKESIDINDSIEKADTIFCRCTCEMGGRHSSSHPKTEGKRTRGHQQLFTRVVDGSVIAEVARVNNPLCTSNEQVIGHHQRDATVRSLCERIQRLYTGSKSPETLRPAPCGEVHSRANTRAELSLADSSIEPVLDETAGEARENLRKTSKQTKYKEASQWLATKLVMVVRGRAFNEWRFPQDVFPEGVQILAESSPFSLNLVECSVIEWQMTEMRCTTARGRSQRRQSVSNVRLPFALICFRDQDFARLCEDISNLERLLKRIAALYSKGTRIEVLLRCCDSRRRDRRSCCSRDTMRPGVTTKSVASAARTSCFGQRLGAPRFAELSAFLIQQHGADLICVDDIDQELDYLSALTRSLLEIPLELTSEQDAGFQVRFAPQRMDLQACVRGSSLQYKKGVLAEARARTASEIENQPPGGSSDFSRVIDKRSLMEFFLSFIPRLSANTTKTISSQYMSLHALYKAYESCSDDRARKKLLADIILQQDHRSSRIRRVGHALSDILYQILWIRDGQHVIQVD